MCSVSVTLRWRETPPPRKPSLRMIHVQVCKFDACVTSRFRRCLSESHVSTSTRVGNIGRRYQGFFHVTCGFYTHVLELEPINGQLSASDTSRLTVGRLIGRSVGLVKKKNPAVTGLPHPGRFYSFCLQSVGD